MQRFLTIITLTLITAITLSTSGCNTGGLSGTGGGTITAAKYEYRFLPSRLTIDLPENLTLTSNAPSNSSPLSILQENTLTTAKQNNLENQLDLLRIDAAFEQVLSFCKDVAINELCIIPAGEIYFTFTQPMANTERDLILSRWLSEGFSQEDIDSGLADLDKYHAGIVGDPTLLSPTEFTKLNGIPYDYNVKQLRGSIYTVLDERVKWSLSWTASKTDAQLFSEAIIPGSGNGIYYSFYKERADGNSMVIRNATAFSSGTASTTKLSIKERNTNLKGVNMRISVSDSNANGSSLIYTLEGVDNSSGGYAITLIEQPGQSTGFKTRETIDSAGARLDYEACLFAESPVFCDDENNWNTSQGVTPRQDIKESEFFTIYNAIDDFSASLGQTGITIQNLPDSISSFVIADQGFPEKREALMCSGQRSNGEILLYCGVDADVLLQMNISIYEEVIEDGKINYNPVNATVL